MVVAPRPAMAERKGKDEPEQFVPEKKKGKERRRDRRAKDVDRSEGGARQGVLELTLGSVVLASAGLLVARGGWEIVRARQLEDECAAGSVALDCEFANPGRPGRIAAGLSFGFAGVLGLASGFLLFRGARINRDYRQWKSQQARLSVQPWASVRNPGGGLSLRLRF